MFHNILHETNTHIKISKAMDNQCQQANHQTNWPAKVGITTNQANSDPNSVWLIQCATASSAAAAAEMQGGNKRDNVA